MESQKTIIWIAVIIVLVLTLSQLDLKFPFAMVTTTTCQDDTLAYWDLDGNVLDARGIYNGRNYGATYVSGKLGQGIKFNTTNYIDFPTVPGPNITTMMWIKDDVDWYLATKAGDKNYVNGALDNTKPIIPIGSNFGLGLNGSVDEISVFERVLLADEILDIYNNPIKVCYTVSREENISCKDFSTSQFIDPPLTGCLNYSGDYFPSCEYEWLSNSGYYVSGVDCLKRFYCKDILTSDFDTLTSCQDSLDVTVTTPTATTPYVPAPIDETFKDKLSGEVYEVAGFKIKLWHLILLVVAILAFLYFKDYGKK